MTSTTLSYTVSVTQPGTSGSSVNISSLPDPLIIIMHLYLHHAPQDTLLGRHLHLHMTGHTPICPFHICHSHLHHNCHKPLAATSPTNGRGKSEFKVCFIAGNISIPKASKDTCHSSALVVHSSLSLHQHAIMRTCHVFRKNGKCFNLCYTGCSIKSYLSTQGYLTSVW